MSALPVDCLRLVSDFLEEHEVIHWFVAVGSLESFRFTEDVFAACLARLLIRKYGYIALARLTGYIQFLPPTTSAVIATMERILKEYPVVEHNPVLTTWALHGDLDVLNWLVTVAGVSPVTPGSRALESACQHGMLDVVRLLVTHGANVNEYDDRALLSAALNGHHRLMDFLFDVGAIIPVWQDGCVSDNTTWSHEFHSKWGRCMAEGDFEVAAALVRVGFDVAANNNSGLRRAAELGNEAFVQLCLLSGTSDPVDIHAKDDEALRLASANGHVNAVRILLSSGATVSALDNESLRKAAENGHAAIAEELITWGADVHVLEDEPIRKAIENRHFECIRVLLARGADVHAKWEAALQGVVARRDNDMLGWLAVNAGCDRLGPKLTSKIITGLKRTWECTSASVAARLQRPAPPSDHPQP
ncbi:Ankyrin repeat domain-containing protein [Plasmodiophora brassicae]|uniref:Uncharacterized protein n=2 Tax=Plasmodiophora brassicae TaxID=37360 RepID=A0A3P3XZW1_PLABS|nr:unnamed protein product [Plasmodiophora brassicae]